MLHFSKDWRKFIHIHQYCITALTADAEPFHSYKVGFLSSSPLTCAQRYIILPPAPHTLSPLEKHASGNLLDNQKQCFLSELNKWLFILKDRFYVKTQLSIIIFFSEQSKEGFSLVWGMLHMSWLFFLVTVPLCLFIASASFPHGKWLFVLSMMRTCL